MTLTASYARRAATRERALRHCSHGIASVALGRCYCRCPHVEHATHNECTALCPWTRLLRGRLTVAYTDTSPIKDLPLQPHFDALVLRISERGRWDRQYPASIKELLEAIELVHLAYKLDPVWAWQSVIRVACSVYGRETPRFLSSEEPLPIRIEVASKHTLAKVMKLLVNKTNRSVGFHLTRRWLLNQYPHQQIQQTNSIPVTLAIGVDCWKTANSSTTPVRPSKHSVFRLEALSLLGLISTRIDDEAASRLPHIQRIGLPILALTVEVSGVCSVESLFQRPANPIQSVVFKFPEVSQKPHTSWWTAFHQACGLDTVKGERFVVLSFRDRNDAAMGIAYALLDPRSPTSVEHVDLIKASFHVNQIRAMNEVLQADRPWELLHVTQPPRLRDPPCCHIKSLHIAIDRDGVEDIGPVLELLQGVGGVLESLSLAVNGITLREQDILSIIIACPRLRRLQLRDACLPDFSWLLDAYESGQCDQLESFVWRGGHIDDLQTILRLLEASNDSTTSIHRKLRDLVFESNQYVPGLMRDISQLLEQNRTIRYVGLDTSSSDPELALDRILVQVEANAIGLKNKLAFVSAVRSRLDEDTMRTVLQFAPDTVQRRVDCRRQ